MKKIRSFIISFLVLTVTVLTLYGCGGASSQTGQDNSQTLSVSSETLNNVSTAGVKFTPDVIPAYAGAPYAEINGNIPYFTADEITDVSFESYSDLDSLGRCGPAFASAGQDLMPTEKRGDISEVKPSGWHQKMYDFVDGNSLYNRCHLLAYKLTAENANEKNLITGTRYFNNTGMTQFEDMVTDYVKETGNHCMYRVTPVFTGDNLVADGVLMEAQSVEDNGEAVLYCVFVYNVQPGVEIDYATGYSNVADDFDDQVRAAAKYDSNYAALAKTLDEPSDTASSEEESAKSDSSKDGEERTYVLNTNRMKFHYPDCPGVADVKESNKKTFTGTREELLEMGYTPCSQCNP